MLVGIYMFKVNNGVFIVIFELISFCFGVSIDDFEQVNNGLVTTDIKNSEP